MLALEVAILSERGGRSYNEDACGHWHSEQSLYCVLADGAGGHGGGDVASRLVVEHLLQTFATAPGADAPALARIVRETNRALIGARVPNTTRANMHSTVVSLAIDFVGQRAIWAHAGDSRLYWFRDRRIQEQTRDHSLVQTLVDAGMIRPEEVRSHPNRSELRSALGVDDTMLEVDHSGEARRVQAGDVFLLCTDGLWEYVPEEQLTATLSQATTPREWLAALERQVKAATHARTDHDNFSALTVWTRLPPEPW